MKKAIRTGIALFELILAVAAGVLQEPKEDVE